jgi:hypothetical protein
VTTVVALFVDRHTHARTRTHTYTHTHSHTHTHTHTHSGTPVWRDPTAFTREGRQQQRLEAGAAFLLAAVTVGHAVAAYIDAPNNVGFALLGGSAAAVIFAVSAAAMRPSSVQAALALALASACSCGLASAGLAGGGVGRWLWHERTILSIAIYTLNGALPHHCTSSCKYANPCCPCGEHWTRTRGAASSS